MKYMLGRTFKFRIDGPPPIKLRARGSHHYTPAKTKQDEKRIREAFLRFFPVTRSELPFQVEIHAYYQPPGRSRFSFPADDGDNMEKAILDALNGLLWADDRQVVGCSWFQNFVGSDDEPHVWVRALELKSLDSQS